MRLRYFSHRAGDVPGGESEIAWILVAFRTLAFRKGKTEKLVDRPLIVGVEAVLAGEHATVAADEEIGR